MCTGCGRTFKNSGRDQLTCHYCREPLLYDPNVKTMDVQVDLLAPSACRIQYNPDFVESISGNLEAIRAVLDHLAYHVMLNHPIEHIRINNSDVPEDKRLELAVRTSLAADLTVNSLLVGRYPPKLLQKVGYVPADFGLSDDKSFEWYFDKLAKMDMSSVTWEGYYTSAHNWTRIYGAESLNRVMSGDPEAGCPDSREFTTAYEMHQDLRAQILSMMDGMTEEHTSDTIDSAPVKARGDIPGKLMTHMRNLRAPVRQITWEDALYSAIKTGHASKFKPTWKRPGRKQYGLAIATQNSNLRLRGETSEDDYKIAFIADSSGSMGEAEVTASLEVVQTYLAKHREAVVYWAWADTVIAQGDGLDGLAIFKLSNPDEVNKLRRLGCGGTEFSVPIRQMLHAVKPDILIYLTDGYGSAEMPDPGLQVIWLLTETATPPAASFGLCLPM